MKQFWLRVIAALTCTALLFTGAPVLAQEGAEQTIEIVEISQDNNADAAVLSVEEPAAVEAPAEESAEEAPAAEPTEAPAEEAVPEATAAPAPEATVEPATEATELPA